MTWIALSDAETREFDPAGLAASETQPTARPTPELMPRGTLIIETRLTPAARPQPLLRYSCGGDRPIMLCLQSIPGGGLTFVLDQGGDILHQAINPSEAGRMDVLRISYSWDLAEGWARLSLERSDTDVARLMPLPAPIALRLEDVQLMTQRRGDFYIAPDVLYFAASDAVEPVGPMPSLAPATPILSDDEYRFAGRLQRGDRVRTTSGDLVPVLHRLSRTVPARGGFSPVRLRAPYFGLRRDIIVAPHQRLVISGSEVEYLFGKEAVLVPACHLVGGMAAVGEPRGSLITYTQLLLPGHDVMEAAGTALESIHIGRLRRQPERMAASLLRGFDRNSLPEHGGAVFPVIRAFEAIVLAEHRAA